MNPTEKQVGAVTGEQVKKIAENKMADLTVFTMDSACLW